MSDTAANLLEPCVEAVRKTDKCFMVGHICRFDAAYALAKEEIAAGQHRKDYLDAR
jgi:predicted dehydrogenase